MAAPRTSRFRPLAGAALCLGLAACGVTRVSSGNYSTFYQPSVVSYAAADGTLPLVVHGNPFPMPRAEAEAAVARNFYLPGWFQQATFVPVPADSVEDRYRVVLVLNAANPVSASTACGDLDGVPVRPPGDEITFRAAFCVGDYVISDVFGSTAAAWPDSPTFRRALGQISYVLFPSYNPLLRDDEDLFMFGPTFGKFGPTFDKPGPAFRKGG